MCQQNISTTELTPLDGKCFINGTCYNDGQIDPDFSCRVCNSVHEKTEFSLIANKCFVNDICYNEGDEDPNDPCQTCASESSTTSFSLFQCSIDGGCHADGENNPNNVCEQCDVSVSMSEWSPIRYEKKNGGTTACGDFCSFVQNQAPDLFPVVCSYPGFVTAQNFNNMCQWKDPSSLNCPAGGITLTRYKAMCSHNTATEASKDPVVCP
ncbi:uncharacterized protein LOC135463539 [Liolophura sinensis]|uniref:uncharacterized protein LOC135463539 n=1 Tax=Liolophura sinensis TaxID=3198878 RepID=UPI0031597652